MMNQTKKHTTSKKLLALLLALIMTVSLLPMSVFAADLGTEAPIVEGQTQQDTEPVQELDVEDEGDADVQNMEGGAAVYADAAQINYVEKTQSVPLKDGTFYRIVHIDCGRKYFSVTELKKIIDYAAASNYTHVELAFGNDGLRFLLDDMEVTASGVTYASENVKSAIQAGNKAFYDAGTNELTQTQMNDIISYANGKGIGIIPMFDAPGHLQTVVRAMATLGVATNKYTTPTTSGTSVNYAIDFTDAASVNFVQALMQKYITYFAGKGCTMFNIAADECGFTSMNTAAYTAYANLVNSMAAMVQNAGMTALAFNDGIYHKNLTTNVAFDTNIAVCYWDASSDKYAPAATLAGKGFKIINTNNKWYYVIGKENITGSSWGQYAYTCEYAKQQMSTNSCLSIDGDSNKTTPAGCMAAIWCDYPSNDANWTNVESYIKTLAEHNKDYFTKVEVPEEVELPAVNDPETKVSVVVKGQEDQSVTVKVKALNARTEGLPASAEKVVSYEITPSVENTAYTGAGKVTLPVPAEWKDNVDRVRGYIVTDGNVETIQGSYDADSGKYTFAVPHFSEMGLILLAADSTEVTENRTITVTVGETVTDTIEGYNYAGKTYPTEDETVAIVSSITGKDATGGDVTYDLADVTYSDLLSENSNNWSDTGYYCRSGNAYYHLYAKRTGNYNNRYTYTFGYGLKSDNVTYITSEQTWYPTYYSPNISVYDQVGSEPTAASTSVSFTGKKADSTTYVTIGHVHYTINVTKENLDGVDPLPIQLWITNNGIQVDTVTTQTSGGFGNSRYAYYAQIQPATAYGKNGAKLSDLIPASIVGVKEWGNVYWDKTAQNAGRVTTTSGTSSVSDFADRKAWILDLLKGTLLSSGSYQTNLGTNRIESGTDFQYVRYYNKNWQVSADGTNWTTLSSYSVTTGSSSGSGTQIVAYYMMRTDVTKEVTTDVIDWGEATPQNTNGVILDYAVKYPNGTQVPSSFPVAGKTMYFNMLSSTDTVRRIYDIKALEESGYEVYMITVTPSSDSQSTKISMTAGSHPTYSYKGTEKVAWVDDEANLPAEFQSADKKYTSINRKITYTVGGEPTIKGVEIYSQQAMLVTYYLRPVVTLDSLHVHYIDKTANVEFHNYDINVNEGTFFDENIGLDKRTADSWKGPLVNGTVPNDQKPPVNQTVSADLSTMPAIGAQYRFGNYKCEEVMRSEDGKEVFLYYTFVAEKTFVVDFGLPLNIKPTDVSAELEKANITAVQFDKSYYATITKGENFSINYTLNKTIDGVDNFQIVYKGTNLDTEQDGTATFTITVIPATNVYYEDSFVTFNSGKMGDKVLAWEPDEDTTTQAENPQQALEELGKSGVYGYDTAYDKCTKFSMGSAMKVTVDSSVTVNPTATFTFTGTGFDVISLTDSTSGAIIVNVKGTDANTESYNKNFLVDNYYGYKYNASTKTWETVKDASDVLYQIPVMKVDGLTYGEYAVTITVAYGDIFDHDNTPGYSFWMDAVRVYNPMGDKFDYTGDGEGYPQYIEIRNQLIDGKSFGKGANGAVFIDGTTAANVQEYKNGGPNNEVYLAKDQSIAFKLSSVENVDEVHIGAKAPMGNASLTVNNGAAKPIATATEMYYDITDAAKNGELVTITNTGNEGTILSLTNVKVTYTKKDQTVIFAMTEADAAAAVAMVRAMYAPVPVEPEVFEPERFEASWNRSTVKVGQKATLTVKTSTDVDAITVDGVTVTNYRTRTQRTGWGWNATKVTYREFTYTVTAAEAGTLNVSVAAVNAEGTVSEPITAALTVQAAAQRPGIGGWLDNIFGRWF